MKVIKSMVILFTEQDYFCVCQTGYKYVTNFGGSNIMCEKCPPQQASWFKKEKEKRKTEKQPQDFNWSDVHCICWLLFNE